MSQNEETKTSQNSQIHSEVESSDQNLINNNIKNVSIRLKKEE